MAKLPGSGKLLKSKKQGSSRLRPKRETYGIYLGRVCKQVHPSLGLSWKTVSILDSFIKDIQGRLCQTAREVSTDGKKRTLTSRDIQTAVRLVLPGELARHAVAEGAKAIVKFTSASSA